MKSNAGADAVTGKVGGSTDDRLDELDCVLRERVVGERPFDVRGVTVAAQVWGQDVEPGGECVDVLIEEACVDRAAVEQHERFPSPRSSYQARTCDSSTSAIVRSAPVCSEIREHSHAGTGRDHPFETEGCRAGRPRTGEFRNRRPSGRA